MIYRKITLLCLISGIPFVALAQPFKKITSFSDEASSSYNVHFFQMIGDELWIFNNGGRTLFIYDERQDKTLWSEMVPPVDHALLVSEVQRDEENPIDQEVWTLNESGKEVNIFSVATKKLTKTFSIRRTPSKIFEFSERVWIASYSSEENCCSYSAFDKNTKEELYAFTFNHALGKIIASKDKLWILDNKNSELLAYTLQDFLVDVQAVFIPLKKLQKVHSLDLDFRSLNMVESRDHLWVITESKGSKPMNPGFEKENLWSLQVVSKESGKIVRTFTLREKPIWIFATEDRVWIPHSSGLQDSSMSHFNSKDISFVDKFFIKYQKRRVKGWEEYAAYFFTAWQVEDMVVMLSDPALYVLDSKSLSLLQEYPLTTKKACLSDLFVYAFDYKGVVRSSPLPVTFERMQEMQKRHRVNEYFVLRFGRKLSAKMEHKELLSNAIQKYLNEKSAPKKLTSVDAMQVSLTPVERRSILDLPDEALQLIVNNLDIESCASVSQSCKKFREFIKSSPKATAFLVQLVQCSDHFKDQSYEFVVLLDHLLRLDLEEAKDLYQYLKQKELLPKSVEPSRNNLRKAGKRTPPSMSF